LTCKAALALGVFAMTQGALLAQDFEADWGYFNPGSGPGMVQGYDMPGFTAAGYDFGLPGFSDGGIASFSAVDTNSHFGLGIYPPGAEGDVAQVSGTLGTNPNNTQPRSRLRIKAKSRRLR